MVEALVCNRLTHPRPLSSFTDWGERFAVSETLGIAAVKLNDDRLGRALDALADIRQNSHMKWRKDRLFAVARERLDAGALAGRE